MTKLEKSLKRLVRVPGVDRPVCAEINAEGIQMWVHGARKRITITWGQVARSSYTPLDIPSYLAGDPIKLLAYQAKKLAEKAVAA